MEIIKILRAFKGLSLKEAVEEAAQKEKIVLAVIANTIDEPYKKARIVEILELNSALVFLKHRELDLALDELIKGGSF